MTWGKHNTGVVHQHIIFEGVTLQSSLFRIPLTDQFKTYDPCLENLGHQNAWDADLMFLGKIATP
jgi:hypothetical protein